MFLVGELNISPIDSITSCSSQSVPIITILPVLPKKAKITKRFYCYDIRINMILKFYFWDFNIN